MLSNELCQIFCLMVVYQLSQCHIVTSFKANHVPYSDVTDRWKKTILDTFNLERSSMLASDMRRLEWDKTLEVAASVWARNCQKDFESAEATLKQKGYLNQNLGRISYESDITSDVNDVDDNIDENDSDDDYNELTARKAMREWSKQKPHVLTCDQQNPHCAAYKQIIWSRSSRVGCSIIKCRRDKEDSPTSSPASSDVSLTACLFNIRISAENTMSPYKRGRACSECGPEAPICYDGALCVERCPLPLEKCDCRIRNGDTRCSNGGTFLYLPNRCSCHCPIGWAGHDCSVTCKDESRRDCDTLYESDFCNDSEALRLCPVTCGNCVPKDAPQTPRYWRNFAQLSRADEAEKESKDRVIKAANSAHTNISTNFPLISLIASTLLLTCSFM